MSYEDRDCDKKHSSDADNTKEVTVMVRSLVVFSSKVQIVMTQQSDANDGKKL